MSEQESHVRSLLGEELHSTDPRITNLRRTGLEAHGPVLGRDGERVQLVLGAFAAGDDGHDIGEQDKALDVAALLLTPRDAVGGRRAPDGTTLGVAWMRVSGEWASE